MSLYPAQLDDASSLYSPVDLSSTKTLTTTLAALCTNTDVTIQLVSVAVGFAPNWGILSIQDEIIIYASISGSNATGCQRGAFGTTAVGHSSGATVRALKVAGYITALQSAVEAVQAAVGVTGSFNFGPTGLVQLHTLTANATISASAAPSQNGQTLMVKILQNATGGYTVTWSADFLGGSQPGPDADSTSIFLFVGYSGKWYQTGPPNIY